MDTDKKFIKSFFIRMSILLAAVIAVVVIFDPFYQYHKPLPGLKAVLTDKEYQCIGTLRTFDYDALIVGSSVCENYNNYWFDGGFGCSTIKAIRSIRILLSSFISSAFRLFLPTFFAARHEPFLPKTLSLPLSSSTI